jgi:hypothetical protein
MDESQREQLYIQHVTDSEEIKRLQERAQLAIAAIKEGKIGVIEKIDPSLKGRWVCCIGGEYDFDTALLIEDISPDDQTLLISAGEQGKQWIPADHLRLMSAISEIINRPIDEDKHVN